MYCFHLYHPTSFVQVCMNATWSNSTELADKIGISEDLQYLNSCTHPYIPTWKYSGCLQILNLRRYYREAYISCTIQSDSCTAQYFWSVLVHSEFHVNMLSKSLTHQFPGIVADTMTDYQMDLHNVPPTQITVI